MLTQVGLRRYKATLVRMGQREDAEFNEVVQAAVIGINRLIKSRSQSSSPTP